MARYRNPRFDPVKGVDPEVYETDAKPVERDGFLIYNRIPSTKTSRGCFDVVLNGVCIAQYCGEDCTSAVIDRMKEKEYMEWLKEVGAVK